MQQMQTKYPKIYADWQLSGLSLHDYLQTQDVYISTYPHANKRGISYGVVVQGYSTVYYAYYELQGNDTYKWQVKNTHYSEFESIEKERSLATYEQAMEQAREIAFAFIRDNF